MGTNYKDISLIRVTNYKGISLIRGISLYKSFMQFLSLYRSFMHIWQNITMTQHIRLLYDFIRFVYEFYMVFIYFHMIVYIFRSFLRSRIPFRKVIQIDKSCIQLRFVAPNIFHMATEIRPTYKLPQMGHEMGRHKAVLNI